MMMLLAVLLAAADSKIDIDAGRIENRISRWMYGSCIEDVNHEIYGGLYAQMVFGESFEEPPQRSAMPLAGWTAYGGEWRAKDGILEVGADPGAKALRDDPEIADGAVACDVRLVDGENAGLILRVQDPRRGADAWIGYEVSASAGGKYLRLGRHRDDWRHIRDVPAAIEPNAWYRLRVDLDGARIRASIEGIDGAVIEHTDADSPILSGKVGLRTWNARAAFRNLSIESVGATVRDGFDRLRPISRDEVSGMWDLVRTGSIEARFAWDAENPFNTSRSQRIEIAGGEGTAGVANRGLNRWGLTVREGRTYEGRVYLRGQDCGGKVTVALQSADGARTYASERLGPVGEAWARHPFRLRSDGTDANARFVIWIDAPGTIWIDQAYLSGTGDDLFKDLPYRGDIARMLVDQGLTVLRYGGSMVNAPGYRWKKMIGDRDRRPGYRGTWYPYSTNGFGIEDFVAFTRAARFECVVAISIEETPEDAADLIDYLNGDPGTTWGRRREENGRFVAPYGVRFIQIGNEERTDAHYLERFEILHAAMAPRDSNVQFIVGCWWEPENPVTRRIVEALRAKAAMWDLHVGGDDPRDGDRVEAMVVRMRKLVAEWAPGSGMRACILEENGGRHDIQRAIGHAHIQNAAMRHGDFILIECPANCLQPWKQNDNGWDQGQVFFTSEKVWGMPPFYAQRMAAANHLPLRVAGAVSPAGGDLDATVLRSEDASALVLRVVNVAPDPRRAAIRIRGFAPIAPRAEVWTLRGKPGDINTPEDPARIRTERSLFEGAAETFEYEFPGFSFTILRFARG
ncbi:MAG: DUF1080 domain-containing protein [Planctomycetes bacterium]|nr:DUF1080 domain-containing protein [Planctomycetota bacterium]